MSHLENANRQLTDQLQSQRDYQQIFATSLSTHQTSLSTQQDKFFKDTDQKMDQKMDQKIDQYITSFRTKSEQELVSFKESLRTSSAEENQQLRDKYAKLQSEWDNFKPEAARILLRAVIAIPDRLILSHFPFKVSSVSKKPPKYVAELLYCNLTSAEQTELTRLKDGM